MQAVRLDMSLIRLLQNTSHAGEDHQGNLFVFSPEGDAAVIALDDEGDVDWVPMEFVEC
jgi:hypothetical protein